MTKLWMTFCFQNNDQAVRPKIKIGLFAVGRPTLQNGANPIFFIAVVTKKIFFFRFAFAVNPDFTFPVLSVFYCNRNLI